MAAGDAGAFVLNIISSVFIISVNKRLMGSPPNFNFRYVVTLNALHYITTSIWTRVAKVIGLAKQEESSKACLLYTSPSPRDRQKSRMPSSA